LWTIERVVDKKVAFLAHTIGKIEGQGALVHPYNLSYLGGRGKRIIV
jgi:uncharacterized NAD-dependent epimerase/dehydratase family protein